MDISYERIAEVNKLINYTPVHGKNYAEVPQKVQAFRNLFPMGYITTEIIRFDPGVVYMKAEAGVYEDGKRVVLATGMAFERQDASNINKTSFIENCETSAIGRALSFLGLGSESSICSVEELTQAIETQNAIQQGKIPEIPNTGTVETAPRIPEQPQDVNPVLEYLAKERETLMTARGISKAENATIWTKQVAALKAAGLIPNKPLSTYSQDDATRMVQFMYSKFTQTGTELMTDDGETA